MSKKQKTQPKKIANGIYFREMNNNTTHFIAYKNGKILNPYDYYQFPQTHGFCQLFAFFLYTGDTIPFIRVNFDGTFKGKQFKDYVNNSYYCFQKILKLLKKKKYETVYNAFKNDFGNPSSTPRKKYGIKRGTKFEKFLEDAKKIHKDQCFYEMGENYTDYLNRLKREGNHEKFEKEGTDFFQKQIRDKNVDIENFKPNDSLCVMPTEGETQFEAFQSIIANSFRGGRNSVYSKLLKVHDIQLIEDNIYNLVNA